MKPKTTEELVSSLQTMVPQIEPHDLARDELHLSCTLYDIRDPLDAASGTIPGARLLSQRYVEFEIAKLRLAVDDPIVVCCYGGRTSLVAARALLDLGYRNVRSLKGGFTAWKDAGLPITRPVTLTAPERQRYSRHLSLPLVGEEGQLKLKRARVAIVGAGGLGSPIALYLAAVGVGHIRLIDLDTVEDSNLQRQVIHGVSTLGMQKVQSAKGRMHDLNPHIEIDAVEARLDATNAVGLLAGADIVIDGSDNFDTRYIVNDAAIANRQTVVSASIFQFSGQLAVFAPHLGAPCYTCLYPDRTPNELAPSCSSAGVIGALAGVVGLMQAMEAVKLILGIGRPLFGKLVVYDGLSATTRHLSFERRPHCSSCGRAHAVATPDLANSAQHDTAELVEG